MLPFTPLTHFQAENLAKTHYLDSWHPGIERDPWAYFKKAKQLDFRSSNLNQQVELVEQSYGETPNLDRSLLDENFLLLTWKYMS